MKLLFLCGRPGVGKLTVARQVAETTGMRLFHNHLVVDSALSLYDFGTPAFVALRAQLWEACFRQLVAAPVASGVVFTFNAESSVPQAWFDALLGELDRAGVDLQIIELTCEERELERRLASSDRGAFGKLTDVARYRALRDRGVFDTPVLPPHSRHLDTTHLSADDTAARVVAALRH